MHPPPAFRSSRPSPRFPRLVLLAHDARPRLRGQLPHPQTLEVPPVRAQLAEHERLPSSPASPHRMHGRSSSDTHASAGRQNGGMRGAERCAERTEQCALPTRARSLDRASSASVVNPRLSISSAPAHSHAHSPAVGGEGGARRIAPLRGQVRVPRCAYRYEAHRSFCLRTRPPSRHTRGTTSPPPGHPASPCTARGLRWGTRRTGRSSRRPRASRTKRTARRRGTRRRAFGPPPRGKTARPASPRARTKTPRPLTTKRTREPPRGGALRSRCAPRARPAALRPSLEVALRRLCLAARRLAISLALRRRARRSRQTPALASDTITSRARTPRRRAKRSRTLGVRTRRARAPALRVRVRPLVAGKRPLETVLVRRFVVRQKRPPVRVGVRIVAAASRARSPPRRLAPPRRRLAVHPRAEPDAAERLSGTPRRSRFFRPGVVCPFPVRRRLQSLRPAPEGVLVAASRVDHPPRVLAAHERVFAERPQRERSERGGRVFRVIPRRRLLSRLFRERATLLPLEEARGRWRSVAHERRLERERFPRLRDRTREFRDPRRGR